MTELEDAIRTNEKLKFALSLANKFLKEQSVVHSQAEIDEILERIYSKTFMDLNA